MYVFYRVNTYSMATISCYVLERGRGREGLKILGRARGGCEQLRCLSTAGEDWIWSIIGVTRLMGSSSPGERYAAETYVRDRPG